MCEKKPDAILGSIIDIVERLIGRKWQPSITKRQETLQKIKAEKYIISKKKTAIWSRLKSNFVGHNVPPITELNFQQLPMDTLLTIFKLLVRDEIFRFFSE